MAKAKGQALIIDYCAAGKVMIQCFMKASVISLTVLFFFFPPVQAASAGPLYDHYQDLKNTYPQFFQRLLDTQMVSDNEIRNWLSDIDDYLANRNEVVTQTNFKAYMTNALLNTLFIDENKAVYDAVISAYNQELNEYFSTGNVSGTLAGFYDAVKTVILGHVVIADPPSNNSRLTNYGGPLKVNISGFLKSVQYYYTLDGSTPTTSGTLYTGIPIEISMANGPKTLRAIAVKNNTVSDTAVFTYDTARGTIQGVVCQEATALRRVRVYLELDGREFDASVDEKGSFKLENVPAGSRIIKIVSDKYLSEGIQVQLMPGQIAVVPELTMRAGDLNGDGKIDTADLGILSSDYGYKKSGEAPYSAADINEDAVVDLSDLGWIATNYGATAN
ncbi:chitobiase/beta-hexosaminidase C-terminal domain-containing protein [Pelotomaculum isophthalicicum JI]|uniref:Chitobiase/beta-hexosaminidase C-terminal domain-containing protein n=1 Tax=Pelotomaculum isophthalicicum JI TaxID=947010 RepID=A0A9X4JV51_9FIRM|nr:chitobiase/beta-hexosaminidase C-terminal domain-containing protein [Pelotomaculum isophthalicicum]MDF9406777.1 chitobiase/beta-hexosaminidase C-terminal domain-containing protein [Pelotomaculum isophthalicicum JI]